MSNVVSEMAGVVAQILVEVGDTVSAGQEVAVIESMKMQIPIQSAQPGTVKEIRVKTGDFVNQGDILIDLE